MKKILIAVFVLIGFASHAQIPTGYLKRNTNDNIPRLKIDSSLIVQGYNGIPYKRVGTWQGSGDIGVDTVNHRFYFFSDSWIANLRSTDTTGKWLTSFHRRSDSVFYVKGGVETFAYKDSIGAGGGGVSDGDKEDITTSGGGVTWVIDAGAVTLSKLADMTTASFLGRNTAGTGPPEVLTVATVKTMLNLLGNNTGDQTITLVSDVLGSGTGTFTATIANDAVTYAKLQNISANNRILGALTSGDAIELTGTQATTILDLFTSGLKGLAPASGGGAVNYLRADGTWAEPPGSAGEVNTASNLGSGLANFSGKVGVDLQFNTFDPADFNLTTNKIFIDYTNGQMSTNSVPGFLSAADHTTFAAKESALTFSTGLTRSVNTITVNTSQNIATLSNLTSNGIIKTSGGVGTLGIAVAGDFPTLNQNTTGSAATLTTGRTIGITGDITYTSPSFNGSSNVTAAGTLATVNADVGSFTNASITVDAKGRITAASTGSSSGESNTASNLGGGLANWDSKSGIDLRFNTFTATDFNLASNLLSIDYANGQAASGSVKGFLTSADWTTFNSKLSTTRNINTTSPLAGGGDLSADRTLTIANAAADGSTKGAASFAAADFNAASGNVTIDYTNGQAAATGVKGFLTGTDWDTFNSKQAGDADLTTIAGLTATTNNFMQASGSAWASRTPTQATATLDIFTTALKGLVPPPVTSDGTKFINDAGAWAVPPGSGGAANTLIGGAGYPVLKTATQEIKKLFTGNGTEIDSLSNTDGLTFKSIWQRPYASEQSSKINSAKWKLVSTQVKSEWWDGNIVTSNNDTLFSMGGWKTGPTVTDSIHYSVNGGVSWVGYAGKLPISMHTFVYVKSPDGWHYLLGADNLATTAQKKTVWRSRDLINWAVRTSDYGGGVRILGAGWSDDFGNIYWGGGQSGIVAGGGLNDIWKSIDGGLSWAQVASSISVAGDAFMGKNISNQAVFSSRRQRVFVIGGGVYDAGTPGSNTYTKKVHSASISDLTKWRAESDISFTAGAQYISVAREEWDGKIWAVGGYNGSANTNEVAYMDMTDTWRSYYNYFENNPSSLITASHAAGIGVHNDKLYYVLGNARNLAAVLERSTYVDSFTMREFFRVDDYLTLSQIKGSKATLLGNNIYAGTASNTIKRISATDNAQFYYLDATRGHVWGTAMSETAGSNVSDTTNESMRHNTSGELIVSTNSAFDVGNYKLQVEGAVFFTGSFRSSNYAGSNDRMAYWDELGNSEVANMYTTNGNGLSIGITPTSNLLEIYRASTGTLTNLTNVVSTGNQILISSTVGSAYNGGFTWYTTDNNATKPKGAIIGELGGSGYELGFHVSNDYTVGANVKALNVSIAGIQVTGDATVTDEAYGVGWNGSLEVPTKNALYDKIETISGGASALTIGTTTITGGTDKTILYDNAGVLGKTAEWTYNSGLLHTVTANTTIGTWTISVANNGIKVGANYLTNGYMPLMIGYTLDNNATQPKFGALGKLTDNGGEYLIGISTDYANGLNVIAGKFDYLGLTVAGDVFVTDEAYDATAWNGSLEVPTKNAIRDKIETMGAALTAEQVQDYVGATITDGTLFYTDGSDLIGRAAISGDIVIAVGSNSSLIQSNAVTTSKINALAVTDAKINDVAVGKLTGITGTPTGAKFLRDDFTWQTVSGGSGDVTKVGTPVDNQIGVWTGNGTIEGTTDFTYSSSKLSVGKNIQLGNTYANIGRAAGGESLFFGNGYGESTSDNVVNHLNGDPGNIFAMQYNRGAMIWTNQSGSTLNINSASPDFWFTTSKDFIVNSGKVGIGATPSEALHVAGNVRFSGALMPNNTAGTSGQVLTSAGAGAVPTWETPSGGGGSGTVNSGTQYRLAYYAATGTAVSEAAAITASRALVSDANGVPTHATTTTTEINYVSGVTSAIQTQLNGKQSTLTNSAGLLAALSDETGTSLAVFNTSPLFVTPRLAASSTTGQVWTATDGSGNGSFQTPVGYNRIMDESSNLTQRLTMNFLGYGANAVDNSGSARTDITVKGFNLEDELSQIATNDATPESIQVIAIPSSTSGILTVRVHGKHGDDNSAYTIILRVSFNKSTAGTLTLGTVSTEKAGEYIGAGLTTASATLTASGNNVDVVVTGEAGDDIYWNGYYYMTWVLPNL